MDLKESSLLARNVAKRRWFVVFICFLIMSPAEGSFMRSIYSKTQSAQTISDSDINQHVPVVHSGHGASKTVVYSVHNTVSVFNVDKYGAGIDGKHSSERTAATMERVLKGRKLSEPSKPKLDRGHGPQHN
ncbi:uncharacterized protein LOC131030190 [Cryptomeria japonica]|uniref:uncharacterized protein LOC131030190 n=1 Tax=Cryptomeria japonica TaxID=3369 RepID=UPI0027DA27C4|nr:uncharacterized protein LOC131030190 [Cryptomeria japonica]